MTQETIQHHLNNICLTGVMDHLDSMGEEMQWSMLTSGVEKAAETIREGNPVLTVLIDNTDVSGIHSIAVLFIPETNTAHITKPVGETAVEIKGQTATVAHALEITALTIAVANQDVTPGSLAIPHPNKIFVEYLHLASILSHSEVAMHVMIPLTLHPKNTNAIIVDSQLRRIDPATLLQTYDAVIQQELALRNGNLSDKSDWMRHTMLVQGKDTERPASKKIARYKRIEGKLPQSLPLLHIGRIAEWDTENSHEIELMTMG